MFQPARSRACLMTADLIDEFLADATHVLAAIELGTRAELKSIAAEMRRRGQRCVAEPPVSAPEPPVAAALAPPWEEGTFPAVLPAWCGQVEVAGLQTKKGRRR